MESEWPAHCIGINGMTLMFLLSVANVSVFVSDVECVLIADFKCFIKILIFNVLSQSLGCLFPGEPMEKLRVLEKYMNHFNCHVAFLFYLGKQNVIK